MQPREEERRELEIKKLELSTQKYK